MCSLPGESPLYPLLSEAYAIPASGERPAGSAVVQSDVSSDFDPVGSMGNKGGDVATCSIKRVEQMPRLGGIVKVPHYHELVVCD